MALALRVPRTALSLVPLVLLAGSRAGREKAEVKSMSVVLRRQQKTICPREPVQMGVFAGAGGPGGTPLDGSQGSAGSVGSAGSAGTSGHAGSPCRASAAPGAAKDEFGGHAEITPL